MDFSKFVTDCSQRIIESATGLEPDQALKLSEAGGPDVMWLLASANGVRQHFKGNKVRLCSIVNAKSGLCGQDCAFCAQSRVSQADIEIYPLREEEWLVRKARQAAQAGAGEFSIVTSGKKVSAAELQRIGRVVQQVRGMGLEPCASLGTVSAADLKQLKDSGLRVFHHNLEAPRSFYPEIITTREFEENVDTIYAAKEVGLSVCCGGIFGLGEGWEQRIELLAELSALNVDRVPVNFLNPIQGTPLENAVTLEPVEGLKIIAITRLMLPRKEIVVAGGREKVLGQLQSNVFFAGANGILVGHYLTTKGRKVEEDVELVKACGLEVVGLGRELGPALTKGNRHGLS